MTQRFAHIQELVSLRDQVRKFPDQADRLVKQAILYALPRNHLRLYEWVRQCVFNSVSSIDVARAWQVKQTYASSMLNELWRFGLLERTEFVDENGRVFLYKAID